MFRMDPNGDNIIPQTRFFFYGRACGRVYGAIFVRLVRVICYWGVTSSSHVQSLDTKLVVCMWILTIENNVQILRQIHSHYNNSQMVPNFFMYEEAQLVKEIEISV